MIALALLLTFAAGVTVGAGVGAGLHARAVNRATAAQVEDLHLKVEVLHESSDQLVDKVQRADRVLAEKDRLVEWLTGAVHDQADRLRRAPTFRTPHAGGRL